MSAGEALKSAVRQRLAGVLEEVLVLIQNTVEQYEARLQRGGLRDEDRDRLRGISVRLQRTDVDEHEKEQGERGCIKEEELDVWGRDPASVPEKPPPRPSSNAHQQHHGNHPPAHKTESEESEDEECPICRRSQQPHTNKAAAGPTPSIEEHRASNPEDSMEAQDFENALIKTEEEDQGYAESVHKSHGNFTDDETAEEGEHSRKDLKRAAANSDQEVAPKLRKTQEECRESEMEASSLDTEDLPDERQAGHDQEAESLGHISLSAGDVLSADEREVQPDARNSSQISESGGKPMGEEQVLEANGGSHDSQTQEKESIDDSSVELQHREDGLAQNGVSKLPTVRLVPLKLAEKPQKNESAGKTIALGLKKLVEANTEKRGTELSEKEAQQNVFQVPRNVSETRTEISSSIVGELLEEASSLSSKKALQKSKKSDEGGSEDAPFRKRLNRKAKTKARRVRLHKANEDSGSASDTDAGNDSDFKMENASDSGDSDDDEGYSKSKKGRGKNSHVRQSGQSAKSVALALENINVMSDQLCSNEANAADLDENGTTDTQQEAVEGAMDENTQNSALSSGNGEAMKTNAIDRQRKVKTDAKNKKGRSKISKKSQQKVVGGARNVNGKANKETNAASLDDNSAIGRQQNAEAGVKTVNVTSGNGDAVSDQVNIKPSATGLNKNNATQSGASANDVATQNTALTSGNDAVSDQANIEPNASGLNNNNATESQLKAVEGAQNVNEQNGGATGSKPKRIRRKGRFECQECGNVFSLKRNLQLHMAVHRDERPFACDLCPATFKRQLNLKAHMSTHAEEKEYQCPQCEKRFTRKAGLDDHLKTHSGVKPYSCTVCQRSFSCRSNLRRHMASHSGLRPFECEVCGKKFGRRSILAEHMTGHTGERAFGCTVCGAKFSRKHNLLKHMRIHRGDRRYRCEECGARFCQKAHLDQHMRQHTGEKPFTCHLCQKAFTRKGYVQQHLEMYCTGNRAERERREKEREEREKEREEREKERAKGGEEREKREEREKEREEREAE